MASEAVLAIFLTAAKDVRPIRTNAGKLVGLRVTSKRNNSAWVVSTEAIERSNWKFYHSITKEHSPALVTYP